MFEFNHMLLNLKKKTTLAISLSYLFLNLRTHSKFNLILPKPKYLKLLSPYQSWFPCFHTYVQRFNHVPFHFKTKTKQSFEELYFTPLPLTKAGILSIKSWSSFGSAFFSWTVVSPVTPIVTVSLVTSIVLTDVMKNWNGKEIQWYNLSYALALALFIWVSMYLARKC